MSREDDIKSLCNSVLEMSLNFYDDPNGGYDYTCPMCHNTITVGGNVSISMSNFKHDLNCGYLIAKDLMTNI